MTKFSVLARNALSNWAGFVANIVVVFVLSPIVVRELGAAQYGIWVFISAVTGYLGLIEAGVTVSTGRMLNFHIGRGDQASAGAAVSAALAFYLVVGAALTFIVFAASPLIHSFAGPSIGLSAFELFGIVLLLVANITCVFLIAVSAQILQAANRFDLRNLATILGLLLRLVLTIPVLGAGGGLLALAGVLLVCSIVTLLLMVVFAKLYGPALDIGPRCINRQSVSELFGFGKWALVNNVSSKIDHQSDVVLVGSLFRPTAVAHYSVAQMLVEYGLVLIQNVIAVAGPDLTKRAGEGNIEAVRDFVAAGARVSAFLGVPLFVGIAVFGMDFIRLWMGNEFMAAAQVLVILAFAKGVCLVSQSIGMSLWAVGRIRLLAVSNVVTSIASICLAISLVRLFGFDFTGIAFGTCLAMFTQQLLILPLIGRRVLSLKYSWFMRHVVKPFVVLSLFFAPFAWFVRQHWSIDQWADLLVITLAITLAYLPIGALLTWGPNALVVASRYCTQRLPVRWRRS